MKCRHETPCSKRCLLGTGEIGQCRGYDKCKQFQPDYKTNADRIRAMSDEELAKFLAAKFSDIQSQQLLGESSQLTATELSVLAHTWYCQWMYWLRQPVKDGDGDD